MKKEFDSPEAWVIGFASEEVFTTSPGGGDEFFPGDNEGPFVPFE